MYGKAWMFLLLFIAGLAVLLLPDHGKRILTLNENHGPSLQDLIGLGMMVTAWLYSVFIVVKNVHYIRKRLGVGRLIMFVSIYIFSIAGIWLSLQATNNTFLWMFIVQATMVNLILIFFAFSKNASYKHH